MLGRVIRCPECNYQWKLTDPGNELDANQVGCCLLALLGSPSGEVSIAGLAELQSAFEAPIAVDEHVLQMELICLRCFAIDYAVQVALGDTPEAAAVCTAFWAAVRTGPLSWVLLCERLATYTAAANTPHELGPLLPVGWAFAKNCCGTVDLGLVSFGSTELAAMIKAVSQMFKTQTVVIGNSSLDELVERLRRAST